MVIIDPTKRQVFTRCLDPYDALVLFEYLLSKTPLMQTALHCWKVFLLHFRATGRTKFALRLQLQLQTLSPDLSLN